MNTEESESKPKVKRVPLPLITSTSQLDCDSQESHCTLMNDAMNDINKSDAALNDLDIMDR